MVVDDQAVVRAGFAAIVDAEPDMTVVGEAGTARAPWNWPPERHPTWS